jgi:hypothetical protein
MAGQTKAKRFKSRLIPRGPGGAWTFLPIPFDVEKAFGSRARVSVTGTMNGFAFQNSLLPQGDGTHAMAVSKSLQAGARAAAGDLVDVTLEPDRAERVVAVPAELTAALAKDKVAAAAFASLSYSHRKEYADWVGGAKKEETRIARAQKSLALILARKHVR